MAVLTVQDIPPYGAPLEPTWAAAAVGGDSFPNDGKTYLYVLNGDASPHTPTVTGVAGARTFGVAPTKSTAVNAAVGAIPGFAVFGPFDPAAFNDANGRVAVTYDGVHADLRVAAVRKTETPGG